MRKSNASSCIGTVLVIILQLCSSLPQTLDLRSAPTGDRTLPDVKTDLYFRFYQAEHLTSNWSATTLMQEFHHKNVWKDPLASKVIDIFNATPNNAGSHLVARSKLEHIFLHSPPRVICEIGVFRGGGTILLAKTLEKLQQRQPLLADSFIVSIDTWLLDLEFVWHKGRARSYFDTNRVGGFMTMYFRFMSAVLSEGVSHRVVPLPSTSSNAALAFLAHGVLPQFIYLDASHANPDVYIDLVVWWALLEPGRWIVLDDARTPAVSSAINAFLKAHNEDVELSEEKAGQMWIKKRARVS